MRKISLILFICSLAFSCESPTTADFEPGTFDGDFRLTPLMYFRIFPHTYGMVTDDHLTQADMFWEDVSQCMSISVNAINNYRILLENSTNFECGKDNDDNPITAAGCYHHDDISPERNSYIAVLASPDLIFPDRADYRFDRTLEYKRIWRHEMVHLGFAIRREDWGHHNGSDLWDCQCPPEYQECLNRELNVQKLETIRVSQ